MDRKEFFEKVRGSIGNWAGKGTEMILQETLKLNGTEKTGIVIHHEGLTEGTAPILYLDGYYDEMRNRGINFEDILAIIKKDLKACSKAGLPDEVIDFLTEWELAKDYVYPVLISAERNQELLKDLAATDYLDLKIIYILRLDGKDEACGTVKITRQLMKNYGITQETLHEQAMRNLENDGFGFTAMQDVISSIFGNTAEEPAEVSTLEPGELYCLTNGRKYYGASGMLDIGLISKATDGQNCYILPSSIHEVLVLVEDGRLNSEQLDEMVRSINASEVIPEEVLSDHVYYFDAAKREILSMAS